MGAFRAEALGAGGFQRVFGGNLRYGRADRPGLGSWERLREAHQAMGILVPCWIAARRSLAVNLVSTGTGPVADPNREAETC